MYFHILIKIPYLPGLDADDRVHLLPGVALVKSRAVHGQVHGKIHESRGPMHHGPDVDEVRVHVCGQEPAPTVARGHKVDGDVCDGHASGLGDGGLECCLDPTHVVVEVGLGLVERDSGGDLLRVRALVSLEAAAVEETSAVRD
jgi:hypothetical protein